METTRDLHYAENQLETSWAHIMCHTAGAYASVHHVSPHLMRHNSVTNNLRSTVDLKLHTASIMKYDGQRPTLSYATVRPKHYSYLSDRAASSHPNDKCRCCTKYGKCPTMFQPKINPCPGKASQYLSDKDRLIDLISAVPWRSAKKYKTSNVYDHQSLYLMAAFSKPIVGNCLAKCSTSLFSSAISGGTLVSK